jgi:glycosyltransferase involved in cell wall biosynthesis
MAEWHILTGEYPPNLGGVGDYTFQIARGLAVGGDAVHVWLPPGNHRPEAPGVHLHPLPDHFGWRGLHDLQRGLARFRRPCRLLVQYSPPAFGFKGMNVGFGLWLASRRRDAVWVMFHEVACPVSRTRGWKHNVMGSVSWLNAALLARRADEVFVSIPAWADLVRRVGRRGPITWLPIPSNIPDRVDQEQTTRLRAELLEPNMQWTVGHFGTFGENAVPLLQPVCRGLLERLRTVRLLLLGRGASGFAATLTADCPEASAQVTAAESLSGDEVACRLAACDLLLQPYTDGLSSRRTTLMAGLALGRPIVSNQGFLSEPLWRDRGAVLLTPTPEPAALLDLTLRAVADADLRAATAAQGAALYREKFSLERVLVGYRSRA